MTPAVGSLIETVVWAAVAYYGIRSLATIVREWPDRYTPAPADRPDVAIPEDLVALSLQERELWAQEEVLRVIRERYEVYGDWNQVRASMGVGAMGA